jgi:glucose/arabinose dehydrogenase
MNRNNLTKTTKRFDKILGISIFAVLLFSISILSTFAQTVNLVPRKIALKDGRKFELNVPAGYLIDPVAEGLKRVRFFTKSPDNRVFVTDMFDMSDNKKGAVYILTLWNEKFKRYDKVIPFMTGLRNPNSAAFYTDKKGQDWFYLAETDKLTRRKYKRGSIRPEGKAEVLATFPDYGLDYKYGGWHLTRTIAVGTNGKIYVSVGTSCNSCNEKEAEKEVRGVVLEMNPDGSGKRVFAKNIRNAVGLKWINNNLFASVEGVDHLGIDKPDETFYQLKDGADYGWAGCYEWSGKIFLDPKYKKAKPAPNCKNVPVSFAAFPAHSSAMGFDYFDGKSSDVNLKNSFLVALHGSTNRDDRRGYKIVAVGKNNRQQDFITGFLQDNSILGRPCDIMKISHDSFLFSDDRGGVIYLVRKVR